MNPLKQVTILSIDIEKIGKLKYRIRYLVVKKIEVKNTILTVTKLQLGYCM